VCDGCRERVPFREQGPFQWWHKGAYDQDSMCCANRIRRLIEREQQG
jgi:hypothetical protein